jgi:hypothetical protein
MFRHGGILLREEKHFAENSQSESFEVENSSKPLEYLNGTFLTPHDPPTIPEIQEIDKNHVRKHNSGCVFESDGADFESKVI